MGDDPTRALTGYDVDPDDLVQDLRTLADAVDDHSVLLKGVEFAESVEADDDAEQTLAVSFIPTTEYDGPLRFNYDDE